MPSSVRVATQCHREGRIESTHRGVDTWQYGGSTFIPRDLPRMSETVPGPVGPSQTCSVPIKDTEVDHCFVDTSESSHFNDMHETPDGQMKPDTIAKSQDR